MSTKAAGIISNTERIDLQPPFVMGWLSLCRVWGLFLATRKMSALSDWQISDKGKKDRLLLQTVDLLLRALSQIFMCSLDYWIPVMSKPTEFCYFEEEDLWKSSSLLDGYLLSEGVWLVLVRIYWVVVLCIQRPLYLVLFHHFVVLKVQNKRKTLAMQSIPR